MRRIFQFAILAALLLTMGVMVRADAEKDAINAFAKGWTSRVLKEKFEAVGELPLNSEKAIDSYILALESPHWLLRQASMGRIMEMNNAGVMEKYLKKLKKEKRPNIKESMLVAWGYRKPEYATVEDWKVIQEIALNPKEAMRVRIAAMRMMAQPLGNGKKQLDQERCKANFETMLEMLREFSKKKSVKKLKKDKNLRWLKWLAVYGMEKLTSEEFSDDLQKWEFWWKEHGEEPLKPRQDKKIEADYNGVKVKGKTAVRKKPRRLTSTELIVLPNFGYLPNYFDPYIYELTQYFKVSTYQLPDAYDVADKKNADSYTYPVKKVAEAFIQRRKEQGGTVGMLAVGVPAFVALEYAEAAKEDGGLAFIICISTWPGTNEWSQGRNNVSGSDESVVHWFGESLLYQRSPPLNEEERFEAHIGGIREKFSDLFNSEQHYVAQVGPDRKFGSGKIPLSDPSYGFKGKNLEVPALFIWGEDDPWFVKGSEKKLRKSFKNCKIVKMPGVARLPWIEDPIGFNEEVIKFMDEFKIWDKIKLEGEGGDKKD